MNAPITYMSVALVIYLGLLLYSTFSSKHFDLDLDSYARGKGTYRAWFIAVVMAVTMVGPADAIALSQKGFNYGLIWVLLPIGAALAQFVTGYYFARRIKESFSEIKTVGDVYISRCGKSSAIAVGVITVVQAIAFSGVLILAGGQVLESFMGINKAIGMIITALIVGSYTSYRGMLAVMKTDAIQALFMGIMLIILLIMVLKLSFFSENINWDSIIVKENFHKDYNLKVVLSMFLGYFLGEMLLPTYFMRVSVSKDGGSAKKGFILTSLILIVWYILITYAGSIGQYLNSANRSANDELIILDVIRSSCLNGSVINNILGALTFIVFISLIHSTFDSFLNTGAISLSKDVIGNILSFDESLVLWYSKQATIGISILGLGIAMWKTDLIDILFLGYTVWVPTILPSLIWIVLNKKKLYYQSFWVGFIIGILTYFLFEYIVIISIPSIFMGLIFNTLLLVIIQNFLMKKENI